MKKSPVATAAMVGLIGLICLATILILAYRHGKVVIARERAMAAEPKAVQEIAAENPDVVEIPEEPSSVTLQFADRELDGWKIVDADLVHVPAFQRPLHFVSYKLIEDGVVSFRGHYGSQNGDLKPRKGGAWGAVTLTVSRPPGGKRLFLKISRFYAPSSFGYYRGPLGNKRP
jgi:hypothetical protein